MNNIEQKKIVIHFKPFLAQDMPLFLAWAGKDHVKSTWFLSGYESIDLYHEKIKGNGYDYPFVIVCNEIPIGYIQSSDLYAYRMICPTPKGVFLNEAPKTFCLDLFIGEEAYLNQGYGTRIVQAFATKLREEFQAEKIVIDPACENKRAIRCYEKAGFVFVRSVYDGVTKVCIMELA